MATNLDKVAFTFLLSVLLPSMSHSQAKSSYYYWNGPDKIEMALVPDHVLEFTPPEQAPATPAMYKTLSEKRLAGGVRLFKLKKAEFARALKTRSLGATKSSPVFRQGSDFKALAGGVLVTFKIGTTDEMIKQYCEAQGLKLKKRYSVEGQAPLWLIESPAGLESLSLANAIQENPPDFVEKAKPNFWQAIDTKELKKINLPRQQTNTKQAYK